MDMTHHTGRSRRLLLHATLAVTLACAMGCASSWSASSSIGVTTHGDLFLSVNGSLLAGPELNNPYEDDAPPTVGGVWLPISSIELGAGLDLRRLRPMINVGMLTMGATWANDRESDWLPTTTLRMRARMTWDEQWNFGGHFGPSLRIGAGRVLERDRSFSWEREYGFDFVTLGAYADIELLYVADLPGYEDSAWALGVHMGAVYDEFATGRFSLQEPPANEEPDPTSGTGSGP